jgi:quinol monooxygenase YgiN
VLTEIVRLPVPAGGSTPVLIFLRDHAFFAQKALLSHRLFRTQGASEVMLILEWKSREEMQATTDNELSTKFRAELAPLLAGTPMLGFYAPIE